MSAFYVVDIATEGPTTRLVEAKTRAQALAFVADGTITVRVASAADMYDLARKGIEREDAMAAKDAEASQAALRG
jgi:hypothetical protein